MGGSGRGGFLLVPQQRKGSLFLKALPFLETTCGILDASGGSVRSGGHVAHVSHSYLLAYCIPLHNFRYGIGFMYLIVKEKYGRTFVPFVAVCIILFLPSVFINSSLW